MIELHLPGKSGLEVLRELRAANFRVPVIMMSGKGDIATAVHAIKQGAFDFIEKPLCGADIVARLGEVLAVQASRAGSQRLPANFPGHQLLTSREHEVLAQCVHGASTKEASRILGISPRTVEDHRAGIMRKLGARNAVDLVRMVLGAQAA